MKPTLFLPILLLSLIVLSTGCIVCSSCPSCTQQVLSDPYMDEIDKLLRGKVQQLGVIIKVDRVEENTKISYRIEYSSGLVIRLVLVKESMQIQLVDYQFKEEQKKEQKYGPVQADGYYNITNYDSNADVAGLTRFMSTKVFKTSPAYFRLTSASYNPSLFLYRLFYRIQTFTPPLLQTVYIQVTSNSNTIQYNLINSNYSQLSTPNTMKQIQPVNILKDAWLPMINSLLVQQYGDMLGTNHSIMGIRQSQPYYQIKYKSGNKNYTFMVVYDYLTNRIVEGKITITEPPTTTSTTTTSSQQQQMSSASRGPASFITSSTTSTTTSTGTSSNSNNQAVYSSSYRELTNFRQNKQISSIITYLSSFNLTITFQNIVSVKTQQSSSSSPVLYQLTLNLTSAPTLTNRTLFYLLAISSSQQQSYSLSNGSYLSLDAPVFKLLTMEDIQWDRNIRVIARWMLEQAGMKESRVGAIWRDFPYYKIRLVNTNNQETDVVVLYQLWDQGVSIVSQNSVITQTTTSQTQGQNNMLGPTTTTTQTTTTSYSAQPTQTTYSSTILPNTSQTATSSSSSTSYQTGTSSSTQTPPSSSAQTSSTSQQQQVVQQGQSTSGLVQVPKVNNTQIDQQQGLVTVRRQEQSNLVPATRVEQTANLVPATKVNTSQTKNTSSSSSQTTTTQTSASTTTASTTPTMLPLPQLPQGYRVVTSPNDPYYQIALKNIQNINDSFIQQGFTVQQIVFRQVAYRVTNSVVYFSITVQVNGQLYNLQPQNSLTPTQTTQQSTQQTTQQTIQQTTQAQATQQSTAQTTQYGQNQQQTQTAQQQTQTAQNQQKSQQQASTSTTTSSSVSSIVIEGTKLRISGRQYIQITQQMAQQAYITLYLQYLQKTKSIQYSSDALKGIYTDPMVPYSILLYYGQQRIILTNANQMQQTLIEYYRQRRQTQANTAPSGQQTTQGQTTTQGQNTTQTQIQQGQQQNNSGQLVSINNTQAKPIPVPSTTTSTTSTSATSTSGTVTSTTSSTSSSTKGTTTTTSSTTSSSATSSPDRQVSQVKVDPYCLCYQGPTCTRCASRYYLSYNNCIQIPAQCLSYDSLTGQCRSCLPGYSLSTGLCLPSSPTVYYISNQCITCQEGYKMVNRKCVYVDNGKGKNVLCAVWKGNQCVECMSGTYLSKRNVCQLVDPFCDVFDYEGEVCSVCTQGYGLRNYRCFRM